MERRILKDKIAGGTMGTLTVMSMLLVLAMAVGLYLKSVPVMREESLLTLLTSSEWKPLRGHFGFFPFIVGSLYVTVTAMIVSLPISLLSAIYLSEYAPGVVRRVVYPALDILAGLPSVIYGVWGTLLLIPWVADTAALFGVDTIGYSVLSGGIVLGVMVLPLITSLLIEIFMTVSSDMHDASLALGATRWQTAIRVVLRKTLPGVIASVVLAISRALGETIAVLMVCGCALEIPRNIFQGTYPIPALIANNYGEMLSLPLYESALMFAALLLFAVVLILNLSARVTLRRIDSKNN